MKYLTTALFFEYLRKHKNGKLDADKKTKLDALGFIWDVEEASWEEKFQELVDYKKRYENCMVPQGWDHGKLATWVKAQRRKKKSEALDPERIKRLDALNFVWDPYSEKWETRFLELIAYRKEYGDCLVPSNWKNKKLKSWLNNQRHAKKRGTLDPERIKRLNEIGFVWEAKK